MRMGLALLHMYALTTYIHETYNLDSTNIRTVMTLSWDLFILLSFVVMGVYGFLLGRGRVFNILINTYVGYVIAFELGDVAFEYLSRASQLSHSVDITLFGAKIFVFALVIFVLTLNSELLGIRDDAPSSKVWTVLYGLLAAGLILSSVFAFMGTGEQITLFQTSQLATRITDLRIFWLIAPIAVVVVAQVMARFGKR